MLIINPIKFEFDFIVVLWMLAGCVVTAFLTSVIYRRRCFRRLEKKNDDLEKKIDYFEKIFHALQIDAIKEALDGLEECKLNKEKGEAGDLGKEKPGVVGRSFVDDLVGAYGCAFILRVWAFTFLFIWMCSIV